MFTDVYSTIAEHKVPWQLVTEKVFLRLSLELVARAFALEWGKRAGSLQHDAECDKAASALNGLVGSSRSIMA